MAVNMRIFHGTFLSPKHMVKSPLFTSSLIDSHTDFTKGLMSEWGGSEIVHIV